MSLLIYWIIFSILEPLRHLAYIKWQHKSPRKWLSLTLRMVVGSLCIWYEAAHEVNPPEIIVFAYIFSAIFLHDTIMSLGTALIFKEYRKFVPWYVNKRGYFDQPQNAYPIYIWIFKLMAAVPCVIMYYIKELYPYGFSEWY